jgi:hypothetical protein
MMVREIRTLMGDAPLHQLRNLLSIFIHVTGGYVFTAEDATGVRYLWLADNL